MGQDKKRKNPKKVGTSKNIGIDFNNVVPPVKKSNDDIGPPDVIALKKKMHRKRAPFRKVMQ